MRRFFVFTSIVLALVLVLAGCPSPTDYSVELDSQQSVGELDAPSGLTVTEIVDMTDEEVKEAEDAGEEDVTVTTGGVLVTWDPVPRAEDYAVAYRAKEDGAPWKVLISSTGNITYFRHFVSDEFPLAADKQYEYSVVAKPANSSNVDHVSFADGEDEILGDDLTVSKPATKSITIDKDAVIASVGTQLETPTTTVTSVTTATSVKWTVSAPVVPFADKYELYYAEVDGTGSYKWTDTDDPATAEDESVVVSLKPGQTEVTYVDDATAGTYYFQWIASNDSGYFSENAPVDFADVTEAQTATMETGGLDKPTITRVDADFVDNQIELVWDEVEGADAYIVYRKLSTETSYTDVTVAANFVDDIDDSIVTYLDKDTDENDLVTGKSYDYKVVASKTEDDTTFLSLPSDGSRVTYTSASFVSGINSTVLGDRIELSFPAIEGAAGYDLYKSTDGVAFTQVESPSFYNISDDFDGDPATADEDGKVYWDEDVSTDTQYWYKVVAYTGSGDTKQQLDVAETAANVDFWLADNPNALDDVGTITAYNQFTDRVILYWTPVEDATDYIIERNVNEDRDYSNPTIVSADDLGLAWDDSGAGIASGNYVFYEDTAFDGVENNDGSFGQAQYRILAAKDTDDDGTIDVVSLPQETGLVKLGTLTYSNTIEILPVSTPTVTETATGFDVEWSPVLSSSTTVAATGYKIFVRKDVDSSGVIDAVEEDEGWKLVTLASGNSISDTDAGNKTVTLTASDLGSDFLENGIGYGFGIVPTNTTEGVEGSVEDVNASGLRAKLALDAPSVDGVTLTNIDDDDLDGIADGSDDDQTGDTTYEVYKLEIDNLQTVNGANTGGDDEYRVLLYTSSIDEADRDEQSELQTLFGGGSASYYVGFKVTGNNSVTTTPSWTKLLANYSDVTNEIPADAVTLGSINATLYANAAAAPRDIAVDTYYVYVIARGDLYDDGSEIRYSITPAGTVEAK